MISPRAHVFERLLNHAANKSFITIDEVLHYVNAADLEIAELDRICEELLDKGVVIRADTNELDYDESLDEISIDKSHIDYNKIYKRVIRIDNTLKDYVFEVKKIRPPQKNEERTLIIQAREGNEYAKSRLISMFLRTVLRTALWYHDKYSLPLKETIQDGNIGLIVALDKMPLMNGIRFSTYASWWIKRSIMYSASIEFCDCFYVPIHKKANLFRLIRILNNHSCSNCNEENICPALKEEVIQIMDLNEQKLNFYLALVREPISIEEYIYELHNEEFFSDNGKLQDEMNQRISGEFKADEVSYLLSKLKPKESDVLMRRFGIGCYQPMTLEEISVEYNVTRERIRQIEYKAKEKLRRLLPDHYDE